MKAVLICASALAASPALAQPDLGKAQPAGEISVYPDARRAGLFYYVPGAMAIAEGATGRPDLSFLHVRYTGSAATGDRGKTFFRSVLTFRVRLAGPAATELVNARNVLRGIAKTAAIELRPLPIRRLDTTLVFAPLDTTPVESKTVATEGHLEPADTPASPKPVSDEGTWRERTYTIGMDPGTAQMFAEALDHGRVALSVGYSFYANAIPEPFDSLPLAQGRPQLVRTGAISITADAKRWPDLVRRIDINDSLPPGYAALDVYCYDFNNELRPDLYETQVEIEAQSVTGRPVRRLVAFQRDQQDLYARRLTFSVAVRLDRPYRYRVIEVMPDGASTTGAWQDGSSWTQILDVTHRAGTGANDRTGRPR